MSDKPSARERLLQMARLGAAAEEYRRLHFMEAVDKAYKDRAVCAPLEKALAEAYMKAHDTPDVLVNVTFGSASEWVIAARAMRDVTGDDPTLAEKGLEGTWEFPNGSAVCVKCKTESA